MLFTFGTKLNSVFCRTAKDICKIKIMYCLNRASTQGTYLYFDIAFREKLKSFSKPFKAAFLFT